MAKKATAEKDDYDLGELINADNPVDSLGNLDFGDNIEGGTSETDPELELEEPPKNEEGDDETKTTEGEEESETEGDETKITEGEEESETEDDGTKTTEGEEEELEVEEPAPNVKEPAIPKSRFDQRTAQLRAAERKLGEAQAKLQESETSRQRQERDATTLSDEQLQAKMSEANTAIIDGDTEKASKLQSEVFASIRQGQQAVGEGTEGKIDSNKIAQDVRDQISFEMTLESVIEKYPALDENSDAFDESLSQEAVGFQKMYFDQGFTRGEATQKSADAVAAIHGLAQPTSAKPAGDKRGDKKADMAKETQKQSTRKKVDAARRAPPSADGQQGGTEDSASSVDIDNISVDDWAALPDSVRSRLLGDDV